MTTRSHSIIFPKGYFGSEEEVAMKGYVLVIVELIDGRRFCITFADIEQLRQNLEDAVERGHGYVADSNLVVLPTISTDNVTRAVDGMIGENFFDNIELRPEAMVIGPGGWTWPGLADGN